MVKLPKRGYGEKEERKKRMNGVRGRGGGEED